MSNPETHTLGLVDWQLFVTLTFARDGLPERVKITSFFAFMREVSELSGVDFSSVLWFLRSEAGEVGGRRHLHALISGLPKRAVSISSCFRWALIWDHEPEKRAPKYDGKKLRMGMARIRVFDSSLPGVDYCLKGLREAALEKNAYEFSKFSLETSALTLSDSLLAHCGVRTRRSSHERRRDAKKTR